MLIPSIDLMGGRIVQLEQGRELKLAFDDFNPWIERFSAYPLVQLIDLDAAMGQGDNRKAVEQIAKALPVQVGGGIRSVSRAREVLSAGAQRVILGSALFDTSAHAADGDSSAIVRTEFAKELAATVGREHLIFGVDAKAGSIAVKGWKQVVPLRPEDAIRELEPYCGGFLYTHIDTEGTMQGFPLEIALRLRKLTKRQLIVAGGIREQSEVDDLSALGVDAVAGMAVYLGHIR